MGTSGQLKEFKIRSSQAGKIMGSRGLGKTGETYCKNWVKSQLFNREYEIKSKYLDKGNIMEDEALDLVADKLGLGMLIKNEKNYANDFMTGTPDAIPKNFIVDVKASWSWETYPFVDIQIPDKDYYWQAQVYMDLAKKKHYRLCYTLLDTPIHLIHREAKWHCINNGYEDMDMDVYNKFHKNMTYSDVPDEKRIKVFNIERNDADIALIKTRVLECREYIKTLVV